ncbi:hypothetical protein ABKV19_005037 [Rosa sericea]
MQKNSHHYKQVGERLQGIPARPPPSTGNKAERISNHRGLRHCYMVSSPRTRLACTCGNRPGLNRCIRHGFAVPGGEKWRKNYANKEILRRALRTAPARGLSLRWWNFQPTPSRLSNMSMAERS